METIAVEPKGQGWRVECDGVIGEVEGAHRDRGAVRAVLTVRANGGIVLRDTVNLAAAKTRQKALKQIAESGVALPEDVLVALDEACRMGVSGGHSPAAGAAPTDISEAPPPLDMAGLEATFRRRLLIEDRGYLPILTGAVLAYWLGGEPTWLLIVAPPGGTKSEVLRSLYGYKGVYALSDLTARTFASGLDSPAGDPSLLSRLTNEILVLKDFTAVPEMHREERQAILAQMRDIYDGQFDKAWGTGRELHWQGRLGFLAGVTPVIDQHQAAMSVLGERFVPARLVMPNRRLPARAAPRSAGQEASMRGELQRAMHGFLDARGNTPLVVDEASVDILARVADFITRARSGVIRDGHRRELEYAPEPEAPTRLAKVLFSLAQGIALAYDSPGVTRWELQ